MGKRTETRIKIVDTVGRVAGDAWQLGSTPAQETGVGYDLQSRLETLSLGGVSATYQYQPGGTTVTGVNRPLSAVVGAPAGVMEGSLSRDAVGRVRTAHWQRRGTIRGTEVYGSVTYQYDAAGRRRQATDFANVSWLYGYNKRGEVTGAEKRAASGTVLSGWGQGYSYDDIGNRRQVVTPEGETLAMSANALNQISTRQTEQKSWLRGRAHPLASVEVDGNAVTREGRNWKFLLNAAGSGSELRIQEYVVQAARADLVPEVGDEINETVTFRPTSVSLTHDDDGNLTFDGRWHYEWDAENRLIGMEEAAARFVDSVGTGDYERAVRLEFAYDALGRRVRKKVLDAPRNALGERSGVWVLKKETVFVWQDWRLLAEYVKTPEITMLQLRRSYLWGMDLVSGVYEAGMAENAAALSPAGGVGGLLWVVDYLPGQSTSNRQLAPWYDGNGNILGWVENELAQVQPLHRLEYDAFGRLLVDDPVRVALTKKQSDLGAAEAWLDRPAFGFSTKYEDWETGLLYYGHRYYAPEVGRWVGRDPIEERGGLNLYGMVGNDAVNSIDVLGLAYPGVEDRNQGFATPDWLPKVSGIAGRKGWGHLQQLFDEWFGHPSFRITNAQDVKLNDPYNNTIISYGWLIGFDRARLQFEKLNNKNTYRGGNERERLRNRIRALGPNTHRFGEDWMNETDPRKLHQHWVGRQDVRGSRISMDALDGALHNFAVYSVVSGCLHKDGDGYSAFITDYVVYAKDSFDFEGSQHLGYWAEPDSVSYLFPTPGSRAVSNNSFQDFRAAKGRGRDFFVFSKPKKFKVKGPAWKVRL